MMGKSYILHIIGREFALLHECGKGNQEYLSFRVLMHWLSLHEKVL